MVTPDGGVMSPAVALADHENIPHGPVLRHVHQSAVNGGIPVGVVITHRVGWVGYWLLTIGS